MRLLLVLIVVAAATVGAATLYDRARSEPAPSLVAEHPVVIPENVRTVTVSTAMPRPSAGERTLSAMLVEGTLPPAPTSAEVLTDTQCVPDEEMISRCRNEMMLPDGSTIVLRHPHDMTKVPCLAPGEQVRLVPESV